MPFSLPPSLSMQPVSRRSLPGGAGASGFRSLVPFPMFPLAPSAPPSFAVPDKTRTMGMFMASTRGTGKSRFLGRVLTFADLLKGIPTVLLDPVGGAIDNLLSAITYLPEEEQRRIWPRVRYLNLAGELVNGQRYVVPMPLYYRAGNGDPLFAIAQRYVDVVRRAEPNLSTATIQGLPRLAPLARTIGMLLTALGLGVDAAESMLTQPKQWLERIGPLEHHPQAGVAVAEYRTFAGLEPREVAIRAEPLRNQLSVLRQDQTMRAIFGGTVPGLSWEQVQRERLCVLVDLREVYNLDNKRFLLLWVMTTLIDAIRRRPQDKGQLPLAVTIDELSYMVGGGTINAEILRADLEELINQLARNRDVWLTLATQEQYQVPELMLKGLLAMGTQIYGATSDKETAIRLARRYDEYNPNWVRKREVASISGPLGLPTFRSVEFTLKVISYGLCPPQEP